MNVQDNINEMKFNSPLRWKGICRNTALWIVCRIIGIVLKDNSAVLIFHQPNSDFFPISYEWIPWSRFEACWSMLNLANQTSPTSPAPSLPLVTLMNPKCFWETDLTFHYLTRSENEMKKISPIAFSVFGESSRVFKAIWKGGEDEDERCDALLHSN